MSEKIVVLTEEPLNQVDVENITEFAGAEGDVEFVLLVAKRLHENLLVGLIDRLSLIGVPRALNEASEDVEPDGTDGEAAAALRDSLSALREAGLQASGKVVPDDAVVALVSEVTKVDARQAVVITTPHAWEDTFHTDWASKAQHQLGIPVLHLYAGTGFIGQA